MDLEKVNDLVNKANDLGLFPNETVSHYNKTVFDKFGNYIFSTDVEEDYENKPVNLSNSYFFNHVK